MIPPREYWLYSLTTYHLKIILQKPWSAYTHKVSYTCRYTMIYYCTTTYFLKFWCVIVVPECTAWLYYGVTKLLHIKKIFLKNVQKKKENKNINNEFIVFSFFNLNWEDLIFYKIVDFKNWQLHYTNNGWTTLSVIEYCIIEYCIT